MIHRMRRAIPIAVALALALAPSGALAYTPYFTVETSPSDPWAGEPVAIVVRTYGDPGHTVPGRDDDLSRSFGRAMATMDNLLVARSDAMADVPIELHRVEIDRFEGVITLPAGDWMVEAFPGRTGWSSPSLPPGYPEPIRLTVVDRDAIEGLDECPVTRPIPVPASFAERLFGSAAAFGNEDLWVGGIGRDGVIVADPRMVAADGTIGWKLGWWRVTPGDLSITGRRLDSDAAPLRATVPDGYGASGFQATGVDFPTGGCWEITGVAGGAPLSFVTFVAVR
jgi:hypothetical protein